MNTNNLPPLPATELGLSFYDEGGMHECEGVGYSEKQMREYGQLCRQPLLDTIEQQRKLLVQALGALERSEPIRAANYDAHDALETELANHLRQQEGENK
jgi:hypothetical protein